VASTRTSLEGLLLSPPVLDDLLHELELWRPREACGFVLGHGEWACRVAPTVNAMPGTGGFAIPDHEIRRVRALAGPSELVAVYHSHPSGLTGLSENDRTALQRAMLPWLVITVDRLLAYAPGSAAPMAVAASPYSGHQLAYLPRQSGSPSELSSSFIARSASGLYGPGESPCQNRSGSTPGPITVAR
jgi:proteasome lid subunit RPN8/RPN11